MKKEATTRPVSPLAGTERAWFEGKKESLRADYEGHAQGIVDTWELSSQEVAALKKKRSREVRLLTFFGTITLRCREGVNEGGHGRCPALAYLGIRPHQRYSPDTQRRMAVLAAEVGRYEKAASVADAAAV